MILRVRQFLLIFSPAYFQMLFFSCPPQHKKNTPWLFHHQTHQTHFFGALSRTTNRPEFRWVLGCPAGT